MSDPIEHDASISLPDDFVFGEVVEKRDLKRAELARASAGAPSLGPHSFFSGKWKGHGFNTIFRPDNPVTPTQFPIAPPPPPPPRDNVLELNLTSEKLAFSPSLGSVPNRGSDPQGDIFLNGVPYLQTISDISNPAKPVGIHVEPGIWMSVPPTAAPAEGPTLVRMGSIPHGTTIEAQGTFTPVANGPPNIAAVDITPFLTANPATKIRFASQTAATPNTPRIPQDLTPFITAGTITQAILDDPNTVLRNIISHQKITTTITIVIATQPKLPLFGGGTDNIAFLLGDNSQPVPAKPNAQTVQMSAVFWIETVEQTITVPIFTPGQPPLLIKGAAAVPLQPVPTFSVTPPFEIKEPRQLKVTSTQIQYSQLVFLNFATLTWPHCSVATLVPASPVIVPSSAWS